MIPGHIAKLAEKYLDGVATEDEVRELHAWYDAAPAGDTEIVITDKPVSVGEFGAATLAELKALLHEEPVTSAAVKRLPLWRRLAIAAAVLLVVGAGGYAWYASSEAPRGGEVAQQAPARPDLLPGTNTATLTLADGSTVVLDSTQAGATLLQGGTRIVKLGDGQLAYKEAGEGPVLYNTLSTPKGGQYRLSLPDGTLVWLNAASSLRYPTAFSGAERRVELSGEAYFEVAKNGRHPFVVATGESRVTVHGTQFNVNAYDDEEAVRTALLEGSVSVSSPAGQVRLVPGQQASVGQGAPIQVAQANVQQAVAWKNGLFSFDNADIKTVMRQVARWYDVDVVYQGPTTTELFSGEVPRNNNASEVLKILELSNIHFRIEGKKIIVMP